MVAAVKGAAKGTGARRKPVVTAAFTLSWDGRVIERRLAGSGVDAVLSDAEMPEEGGAGARVLISGTGRIDTGASFLRNGPVIIFSTARMPRATRAALGAMPNVRVHLRAAGEWALREVLEHLLSAHGMRRVAVSLGPERFRELASGGLLDELRIGWRACVAGGKSLPPMTGFGEEFLPRGIALDLLKLGRKDSEYLATYRVHRSS